VTLARVVGVDRRCGYTGARLGKQCGSRKFHKAFRAGGPLKID